MLTNSELAALVQRIRSGDTEAFREFYEATYKSVFFHATTILKNEEDVEDAVQEAYEQAYLNINNMKKPEAAGSWINQIVSNISLNKVRAHKRRNVYSIDDEDFYVEPQADAEEMPDAIAERESIKEYIGGLIDQLPDAQKVVVVLFYFDNMSVREIARQMGCSEGTVKSRLNYARKTLKLELEEE